jgi:hypothetical protein
MARSIRRFVALGFAISLLIAPGAEGAVTIGSNLGREPDFSAGCGCTNMQTALPSASQAANGLTSPVNGTVISWSVRSGATSADSVALRVIRPLSGGLFLGGGTSTPQTPPASSTMSYPTSLPIAAGDRIGLNWGSGGPGEHLIDGGGSDVRWAPALADGEQSAPDFTDTKEVAVNATIEPTAAFTLDGVQSRKGSVTVVTVTVQNLGKLTAGDPSSPNVGAAAAKKKKKKSKLFNNGAFQVGGPGQIQLSIRASKTARKRIREKGKAIKAQLKIAFVPTGGSAAAQTVRVKLKP